MKTFKNDITSESAWKRTSQFILEKYGKRIEFRFLSMPAEEEQRYFTHGDDLIVSLKYKNTDLGSVVVCRGAMLSYQQQQETVDLIQFLIEPQVYNRMLELQINSSTLKESENNVIRLFGNTDYMNEEEVIVLNDNESRRRLVSPFIHVKAHSRQTRHKVALKIHEMTGTIVFLNLKDFADGKEPITHEMDLTDTTIYIDDLTQLNKNQMDLLERLSRQNLKSNSALIVGSDLSEDQIHHLNCSMALKNDLLALAYDVDRVPVSQQASEEILDLLFFNDGAMIS